MWDGLDIENWIPRAAWALAGFYSDEDHTFFTDSRARSLRPTEGPQSGAMSANRAFTAALEFLYRYGEHNRRTGPYRQLRESVVDMCGSHYGQPLAELRSHSGQPPNTFTDSHLSLALSASLGPLCTSLLPTADETRHDRRQNLEALSIDLIEHLTTHNGGRMNAESPINELVTLHAVRAFDASARFERVSGGRRDQRARAARAVLEAHRSVELGRWREDVDPPPADAASDLALLQSALRNHARSTVISQLGLQSAADSEFDAGTLLASTCVLQRLAGRSGRHLIERGLAIMGETQAEDGTWRAELVAATGPTLVYVSSLEMAVHVANLALADLSRGEVGLLGTIERILERSFGLLEAGYRDLRVSDNTDAGLQAQGWANDRTRARNEVESWTTALAVQLLIRMAEIRRQAQQHEILRRYRATGVGSSIVRWPDSEALLGSIDHRPDAIDHRVHEIFSTVSDPSSDRAIIRGIACDLVRPILSSPYRRPAACSSFLLYGPPGTRKTTLVRSMARCLGWPLLSISPAHLLVDGIDGLEARAEAIFDDLLRLKRVVVLFDECEEFFRRRLTVGSPENRTQGAFITAGMLPRLQDLRQRNWTVFVIATNTELEELDPAVIRRGRLDKKQRLGHPTLAAQADYLVEVLERGRDESAHLGRSERSAVRSALVRYDEEHLRERRTVFNDDRKKALELRKQDGDMREYFERVNRTAIKEAELPVVTFSVLDAVAAALDGSRVVDVEEVYVALCWVADAEETDGWAVVP